MSARMLSGDLRGLLAAMHGELAAALAVRPQLAEDGRELDAFVAGVIDRHLPEEIEALFRLAAAYPALLQRPLPPELLEEEGLPECAASCLALNLRFFCASSLHEEARRERLTPAPGERPGLLDGLSLSPPAGPAPGMRRIEQGALADFDEWLAACDPSQAAEDLRATISQIAQAWLPDESAVRAWLDLVCQPGSVWLAEREPDDDLGDELSPVGCMRANLHGWLVTQLNARLDEEKERRPDLVQALEAFHDLSGVDVTVKLDVCVPDQALARMRSGTDGPGEAALAAISPAPERTAAIGLRLAGAAWRYGAPAALGENQRDRAARIARESGLDAALVHVELVFAIVDGDLLRSRVADLHGHPGEPCTNVPSAESLATEAFRSLCAEDADSYGVLLL